jgi:hypothetical protein
MGRRGRIAVQAFGAFALVLTAVGIVAIVGMLGLMIVLGRGYGP